MRNVAIYTRLEYSLSMFVTYVYMKFYLKLISCSFILRLLYPNPSDLGSQASSGEVSSTVREDVRSPRDECFAFCSFSLHFCSFVSCVSWLKFYCSLLRIMCDYDI